MQLSCEHFGWSVLHLITKLLLNGATLECFPGGPGPVDQSMANNKSMVTFGLGKGMVKGMDSGTGTQAEIGT